jgi:Tfp pilus assembly protein PilF
MTTLIATDRPALLAYLLLAASCALPAGAAPYLPTDGKLVVETLPRRTDANQLAVNRLRAQLSERPTDLALATDVAARYIALGRSETDPRYLGYAEAALAPWWRQPAPPAQVRLLRATLLQSTHRFDAAMADLDAVLAADPRNAQAWLTRATVQTVQGNYAAATASCARLSSLSTQLVAITCIANVGAASGRTQQSEQLLDLTLQRSPGADPQVHNWALTLLAEMAARRANAPLAEARFKAALAIAPRDSYLLGAYADFLLDQRRPAEVIALLRDQTRIDALLLRRAEALKQSGGNAGALAADVAQLVARFDAAERRGDSIHQREQARFELMLRGDPARALQLAQRNWAVQKEAADIRIFLEAAVQANNAGAAKPVLDWMLANQCDDVTALRLASQLRGRNA